MRATAALMGLSVLAAALAGCTGPPPSSPVAALPKIIIDHRANETRLYLTSVNADVRYGNLSVSLNNTNLTQGNLTFRAAESFTLNASTNLLFFTVNATADEGGVHYFYNASVHIAPRDTPQQSDPPLYQAFIRDTPDGPIKPEALPSFHILAEGWRGP